MSRLDPLGNRCDYLVRVHIRHMQPVVTDIAESVRCAQRVYGGNKILFEVASTQCVSLRGFDIERYNIVNTECSFRLESREHSELFARAGVGDLEGITVFYVRSILTSDGASNGCASHPPHRPSVLIGTKHTPWTLAHEVGHVLLGPRYSGHTTESNNLMYGSSFVFNRDSNPELNALQLNQIVSSPFVRRC